MKGRNAESAMEIIEMRHNKNCQAAEGQAYLETRAF